jgi:uncharacterized membrane protein
MENTQLTSIEDHPRGLNSFLKREWLQLLILIAPFVLLAFTWSALPDRIPSHWNLKGEVNDSMGKFWGTMLLPIVNIGLAILLGSLPLFDPKKQAAGTMRAIRIMRLIMTTFLLALYVLTLEIALGAKANMSFVMFLGLPLLFLAIGNYLPTVRPNYFVGVRTPWTLEDPENWRMTHKFTGKLWVISSVIVIIAMVVLPDSLLRYVFVTYIGIVTVPPLVYSFLFYRRTVKQL